MRERRLIGALLVGVLLCAASARGAASFDPAFRFRTIHTPHFVIYFHQGEERLAGRLAVIAEEIWRTLGQTFGTLPPPLTHVVLADGSERAGGTATPAPYNTIILDAAWPAGSDLIGNADDWLRLVFGHEFTHITHLDRSESWARVVRNIFGRAPIAFPNLFLPGWQTEGLATYEESALTGDGRLHDGNFLAIVDEAARQGTLERLDRVNGGLVDWPGGQAPYAYGAGFHQYLADRFGAEKLGVLAEATARRVPYTGSRVFPRVFGKSLGDLWNDYLASTSSRIDRAPSDAGLVRLTHHRFTVVAPRFDRFVCDGCPQELVYSLRTPHSLPTLNRIRLDGTEPQTVTTRILGSTTAIGRDALYFDQEDVRRNTSVYSDLYELTRGRGRVRKLTSESRLLEPDLSPDGTTLAAVQSKPGQRDLVLIRDIVSGRQPRIETVLAGAETQFDAPRWSPDGKTIAVERHRLGAQTDIVLVDVATKSVRVVAAEARGRAMTPAWRPDGQALVVAIAHENEASSLYEVSLDAGVLRRLTHLQGGVSWPDVSPDGRTLAFVGYTAEGFELFSMPYPDPSAGKPAGLAVPSPEGASARAVITGLDSPPPASKTYSPLGTLKPTSWSPVVLGGDDQLRMGAAVFGSDVLGYHRYAASATWLVASPSGSVPPAAGLPDWQASYVYDRWRLALFASASLETSFLTSLDRGTGQTVPVTLREYLYEAGVQLPVVHVRRRAVGQFSIVQAFDDYAVGGRVVSRDRPAVRAAAAFTSAHRYSASISDEDGIAASMTAELTRDTNDDETSRLTAEVRGYVTGGGAHRVIALRVAAATATGSAGLVPTFRMGGSARDTGLIDFSTPPTTLLRGFPSNTFGGSHEALVNVEYRVPLARPQRGSGTWPIFVRAIHVAPFADAGQAWTTDFKSGDLKTSFGVEVSADTILGFYLPLTATVGGAWGHDGSGKIADQTTFYIRLGHAF